MAWRPVSQTRASRPRVPDGTRIYAVGDVHGRADLLAALLKRIDVHRNANPIGQCAEVFLGDYIDRGPHSREVIDILIERQRLAAIICLMGNHETFAAEFLVEPSAWSAWKHLGGPATLLSYGVAPTASDDLREHEKTATAFRAALPESHYAFLHGLALSFTSGDFFFVHAGVRPGIPLREQRADDLLWIREEFLLHEGDFGKVVVHGHTPAWEPEIRSNRINIDTGAYATGRLTCLVLEGDRIAFI